MIFGKVKIYLSDKLFSILVRKRDRKCVFGVKCIPAERTDWQTGELDIKYLSACHFIGRRNDEVRIDPRNADAGCGACHKYIDETDEGKKWHREFKKKQLGEAGVDKLMIDSTGLSMKRVTENEKRIYVRILMKEMGINER
ncbi:MAG: hypothetical protein M0R80_18400 [Proteobacteria bacterium]|jgi:hypothetical protein|nr:hypothetical protein [Pseudomonadota bacterium]